AESLDAKTSRDIVEAIRRARRVYIAGVGRSGLVVKAFGQRLMHLGFEVHLADEITAPAIGRKDLLLCCSGTGRTQMTVYMARKARSAGARVVSFTAEARSPLARLSHIVSMIAAPLEHGSRRLGVQTFQPARSLFEQVLFLYLDSIVLGLMETLHIPRRQIEQRHGNLE
ncbi:MAG TPA: 6-phospho-3-hexuloisomerase, partial [Planctomycetota bacterium]|nr:6-phospho-3-hexuloisomerase [Planctomycetota bacterium]